MKPKFTIKDLEEKKRLGLIRGWVDSNSPEKQGIKKSKYGNKKVVLDGITFDSKREAKYYGQLKFRLLNGEIQELKTQVPFELNEGGTHSLKYVADFCWLERATGEYVICDVKGYKTKVFLKKQKLMFKIYGIKIKII
ncbi:MAG: DUF1064 domain-containing protein [Flavisolibacter sp.]